MTLYRDKTHEEDERDRFQGCSHIEVRPCIHGNYARHIVEATIVFGKANGRPNLEWCDGKPEVSNES